MNHLSNNNQHRWTRSELVWSVISVVKRQTLSRGRKKMMIERWDLPTVIIGIMRSHFGVTVRDEEVSLDLRSRNGIRVAIRWQKWHHPTPKGRINSARFYMQSSWLYHPIRIARSVLTGTDGVSFTTLMAMRRMIVKHWWKRSKDWYKRQEGHLGQYVKRT